MTHNSDLSQLQVAVIGAGNMGGPVVRTLLASGVSPEHLQVVNSSYASSERTAAGLGVVAGRSPQRAAAEAQVLVLGVKPYLITDLLSGIRDHLAADTVVISLAAGVTNAEIEQALPAGQSVLRAMPNTPISVGEGAVGIMAGSRVDDRVHDLVHALFARAGVVVDITEEQVHAFIGAAGSLSAVVFYLIEAMTDEAVRQGLKRDLASDLVQQTVRGAATMLRETGQHPALARNGVSSPGGTTVQGLAELDRQGVRAGIGAAMAACAERSRAMTEG